MSSFVQTYNNQVSAVLTWTENGGVLPTPYASRVKVYQNGVLLAYSTQYTISGATITIEDADHISGATYIVFAEQVALAVSGLGAACLDTIVGLSREDCSCFTTDRPADYNTSDSGYYLTDPEYGVPMLDGVLASADCGQDSAWDVLDNARTLAIEDFKVDIWAALNSDKVSAKTAWKGVLGKPSANRSKTPTNDFIGQVIKPVKRLRHQKLVITSLYLGADITGNVDVSLNSNAYGFTQLTETVASISGQFDEYVLPTPWELDLFNEEIPDLYYTISYDRAGNTVQDNKIWCCGSPSWMKSVRAFGFTNDSITDDFSDVTGSNQAGNGLAFKGYIYCDNLAWICELEQLGGKEMKSLIGRAVQYKATVKLLSRMLETQKINQYTLLNFEQSAMKMAHAQERYNEILTWITQNMPSGFSGCFECSKSDVQLAGILM